MVTIAAAKFVSIEAGRGLVHVVFIEPWDNMEEVLSPLEADEVSIEVVTDKGEWVMEPSRLLNYDVIDKDLTVATFQRIFWN
jgi:hypothetical protein